MDEQVSWPVPAARPELGPDEIQVWRLPTDLDLDPTGLAELLDDDERRRVERFHFEHSRRALIATHGVLRALLGHQLGLPPARVGLREGPHGKPAVDDGQQVGDLRFNLSHTADLALIALTRGREVGVDVERVRVNLDFDGVARQVFSEPERAAIRALPAERRPLAFFACWTRKEAIIKARGEGFSLPLDSFDVAVDPDLPAALLASRWSADDRHRWWLANLVLGPDHLAALAVEGEARPIRQWSWPGWKTWRHLPARAGSG